MTILALGVHVVVHYIPRWQDERPDRLRPAAVWSSIQNNATNDCFVYVVSRAIVDDI